MADYVEREELSYMLMGIIPWGVIALPFGITAQLIGLAIQLVGIYKMWKL